MRRSLVLATLLAAPFFCAACFPTTGSGSGSDAGATAITGPALELTVGGTTFGPSAIDSGSGASLTTTQDSFGNVVGASFSVSVSSAVSGTACNFSFTSTGAIGAGQYTITSSGGAVTNGVVAPSGSERIVAPDSTGPASASCSGTDCDGGVLSILALDAAHVYGYVSENVIADNGAGGAAIVCTFWVPMTQYAP